MGQFKTPLVSKFRKDSATFYTFGSAIEDIGLNINEKNNQVRLTNYVLLNLPKISFNAGDYGEISADKIVPAADVEKFKETAYQDYAMSSMLQNYVLNFETRLRNQSTYDFSASSTVTEKVFWKWLQKTGALALKKQTGPNGETYYHEDFTNPENTVIKGFGQVTSSSQASNTYNMNNETYIMIPSSYGQMKYYMSEAFDTNYSKGKTYIATNTKYLEGFNTDDLGDTPDASFMYRAWADNDTHDYIVSKDTDGLQFEFDINDIRKYVKSETSSVTEDDLYFDRITYDNMAIDSSLCLSQKYKFNTILLYYTIYDKSGKKLATNLFGVMVLDSTNAVDGNDTYAEPLNITFADSDLYSKYLNVPSSTTGVEVYETEDYPYNSEKVIGVSFEPMKSTDFKTTTELQGVKKISFSILAEKTEKLKFGLGFANLSSASPIKIIDDISLSSLYDDAPSGTYQVKVTRDATMYKTGVITYTPIANLDNTYYEIIFTPDSQVINDMCGYAQNDYLNGYFTLTLSRSNTDKSTNPYFYGRLGNIRFEFVGGDINPLPLVTTNRTFLEIPSLVKTQSTEGSFGSEYSFRVNLQTASIYDKDSSIIDYSTSETSTITDFNSVLTNLKNAVDILKNNAVVIYGIYQDNQGLKQLVANSVDKVNDLEKNVNDILYGNVRTISADTVDTNSLKVKAVDSSLSFTDEKGNVYGKLDGSTLTYRNIDASTINLSNVTLSNVTIGDAGLIVSNGDKNVLRVDSNGNIYTSGEKANTEEIGRWFIADVPSTTSTDANIYELLVKKNLDDIVTYIEKETGVEFKATGYDYNTYLKKYWRCLVPYAYENKDNTDVVRTDISPYGETKCKVIRVNAFNAEPDNANFLETELEFHEYTRTNSTMGMVVENTMDVMFTSVDGSIQSFAKRILRRKETYNVASLRWAEREEKLAEFSAIYKWKVSAS